MEYDIRRHPETRTVAFRHIGPYMQITAAFERLNYWATAHDLSDRQTFAVYYDDPATVPESELRSDACIEVEPDFQINDPRVLITTIPAGTYAVATYIGPYGGLVAAWDQFMNRWLPHCGYTIDANNPCGSFEKYLNDPRYVPAEHLITELYQAVLA